MGQNWIRFGMVLLSQYTRLYRIFLTRSQIINEIHVSKPNQSQIKIQIMLVGLGNSHISTHLFDIG